MQQWPQFRGPFASGILEGARLPLTWDIKTGENILRLMKNINEADGTTFIFSTHDLRVMEMADRVIKISDGRLAA